MGFADTSPSNVIKKLEVKTKNIMSLHAKEKKKRKYAVIYSLILMLRDSKIKDHLNVYLTTETGDQHIFETWDILPPSHSMKAWSKVSKKELG